MASAVQTGAVADLLDVPSLNLAAALAYEPGAAVFSNCIARHDVANPLRSERSGPYRVALCHRSAAASLLVRPGGGSLGGPVGSFRFVRRIIDYPSSLLTIWNIGEFTWFNLQIKSPNVGTFQP